MNTYPPFRFYLCKLGTTNREIVILMIITVKLLFMKIASRRKFTFRRKNFSPYLKPALLVPIQISILGNYPTF